MPSLKGTKVGLVKLEISININSLLKGKDFLEIDYNYNREFIKEDIKELVEKFAKEIEKYSK